MLNFANCEKDIDKIKKKKKMRLFYPLPVTSNYSRRNERKKNEDLEKKEPDKKQTDGGILIGIPDKHSKNGSEKRTSIWHQIEIDRRLSEIHPPSVQMIIDQRVADQVKPLRLKWSKEVYLFDVVESRYRNFELEKRFRMYMPQSYFGNELRSTTLKYKTPNSFYDIIYLYNQFAIVNADEERNDPQHHNFQTELLQTFFAVPESYSVEADKISDETIWLKLMSWWKSFNQSLVPCCQELHKELTTNTENSKRNQNIIQLRNTLNDSLKELDLFSLPAEIVVIKMYVEFSKILLDIDVWSVNQESALKEFHKDYFPNVSLDSLWRNFLTECSHNSLNLLCNVMKFISENGFDANHIGTIIINNIENFVSRIIEQHLTEKNEKDYINALTETILKKFDKFLTEINVRKLEGDSNLTTVVYLCCQLLSSVLQVTVRNFEHLFGDSYATPKKALLKYLFNTVINGSIVGDKALQNDSLVSRNLLLQLKDEEMHASTTDLSIERMLKFAYILSVSYQFLNEHNTTMVVLPSSYIQNDFLSFLDDIKRELNITPCTELSMIEYSLEMRIFQDQLLHQLGTSLRDINKTANNAKILLSK